MMLCRRVWAAAAAARPAGVRWVQAPAATGPRPPVDGALEKHKLYKVDEYANLSKRSRAALTALGYKVLFPVQAAAFEPVKSGGNVAIKSSTGSGKTLSYVLPLVDTLIRSEVAEAFYPSVLVVVPTRDLAPQIANAFLRVSGMNLSVLWVGGGRPVGPEVAELKRGVDIVVGTPGRIRHHMTDGHLKLDRLKTLVVEEGDHLLGDRHDGIRIEVLDILRDIVAVRPMPSTPAPYAYKVIHGDDIKLTEASDEGGGGSLLDRDATSFASRFAEAHERRKEAPGDDAPAEAKPVQVVIVSATHPGWMKKMYQMHRFFQPMSIVNMVSKHDPSTSPYVTHEAVLFPEFSKTPMIAHLIEEHLKETNGQGRALVFVPKLAMQHKCHQSMALRNLVRYGAPKSGNNSVPMLSRDESNARRAAVLEALSAGEITFVVATDIASRGLDVDNLTLVINVGIPPSMTVYVSRSGRVGRGGKPGKVVTIISPGDTLAIRQVSESIKAPVDLREVPTAVMTVLREEARDESKLQHRTSRYHGIAASTKRQWGQEWYANPTWGR
eukprot:TRINITY_DN21082_c0_g1_i1.p1 TRINITY_DN21082_c0_g1~~TRINITY_DN21082_c0_g1_i1.p1  ORF type:complete len:553 (+),score=182.00 TRINITY_DN21082_c0_g1_i1:94-1752(+)